jgi:hypothetical protein
MKSKQKILIEKSYLIQELAFQVFTALLAATYISYVLKFPIQNMRFFRGGLIQKDGETNSPFAYDDHEPLLDAEW